MSEVYVPSTCTEPWSSGAHATCTAVDVQLVTRTLHGVAGADAVCTVMPSDLAVIMNVLLHHSFAVTHRKQLPESCPIIV